MYLLITQHKEMGTTLPKNTSCKIGSWGTVSDVTARKQKPSQPSNAPQIAVKKIGVTTARHCTHALVHKTETWTNRQIRRFFQAFVLSKDNILSTAKFY
jgi:hypothetical protein